MCDRREGDDHGKALQDLNVKKRSEETVDLIHEMGGPRIEGCFRQKMEQRHPDFTCDDGKKIACKEESEEAVLTCEWNDQMRGLVFCATHVMWGKNNAIIDDFETETLDCLKWKYSGHCLGKEKKRQHLGGCIKQILVSQKNCLLDAVRKSILRRHCEMLCVRKREPSKKKHKPDRKSEDPWCVCIEKATVATHGFEGWLGCCCGHPLLKEKLAAQSAEAMMNGSDDVSSLLQSPELGFSPPAKVSPMELTDDFLSPLPTAGLSSAAKGVLTCVASKIHDGSVKNKCDLHQALSHEDEVLDGMSVAFPESLFGSPSTVFQGVRSFFGALVCICVCQLTLSFLVNRHPSDQP